MFVLLRSTTSAFFQTKQKIPVEQSGFKWIAMQQWRSQPKNLGRPKCLILGE